MPVKILALLGAAPVLALVAPPVLAQTVPAPAPVSALVAQVDIPYQDFTLPNGLRVIVHTDRKAPVVAVSMWYDVGAKHEPAGKTGFAHLFEHLMFNGSENAPGDFFEPLKQVGATDFNGTTYFDRTNYFETVPTAALDRALFLESDRMGYLLGAITQGVLDEQRGVVQNEKRQGDNRPYGLLRYAVTENLFPAGHPYGHDTIGSMADLDAASLATVKDWFRDHYGPNNAVLVLAGDIDAATARPLVEKYFGAIARGPETVRPNAPVPTLLAAKTIVLKDRVAQTLVSRQWAVPGLNDRDSVSLDVAAAVLGGMASSRLTNQLVRKEQLFVQVGVDNSAFAQVGTFEIYGLVRPGIDPAVAAKRMDAVVADFLRTGPTADEVARVVTGRVVGRIRGLESVGGFGGKAVALAEGALYSNDPGFYRKQLALLAATTPADVRTAAAKWLSRPALTVDVVPGERGAYAEAKVPPAVQPVAAATPPARGTRGPLPAVAEPKGLAFPAVVHDTLSNGIRVAYAQRSAVPMTQAVVSFDAGTAADVAGRLGTQNLTIAMMDEGVPGYDAVALAEARERLGASIGTGASEDRTTSYLAVPSVNLAAAADLWSRTVRQPTFPDSELARVKAQQLAAIQQELTTPRRADRAHPAAAPRRRRLALRQIAPERRRRRRHRRHPCRSRRLPPCMAAPRQGADLRHVRPAAGRGEGGAGTGVRRLARDRHRRHEELRAGPLRHPAHRADRPAGQPAIGDRRRRRHRAGGHRRPAPRQHRQRRAGRQLPVADQHEPARGQALVLRRWRRFAGVGIRRALFGAGRGAIRQDRAQPGRDASRAGRFRHHPADDAARIRPRGRRHHPRAARAI